MYGNLSTTIRSSSPSLLSSARITSAPSIVSAVANASCPQCQVVARFGPLSMALWWSSSIDLTLDTVSVLVTQYNNTAVTRTTTIHQDLSSLNVSTMSKEQSLAFDVLTAIDPEYEANGFALNNGTNAFIDGTFSVAYPTPFIGIQGFEYITVTQQDPKCPNYLQYSGRNLAGTTECACMMQSYMENPDAITYTSTSMITLSSTYYELGDRHPVSNDLGNFMEGPLQISNTSFSNFIESVLGSEGFNKYRSCAFPAVGFGPPALMIPVAALTATTTSSVKSAGNYATSTPKPGNVVSPTVTPPTSTPVIVPSVPVAEPKASEEPQEKSSTAPYKAPQTDVPNALPPVPIVEPNISNEPQEKSSTASHATPQTDVPNAVPPVPIVNKPSPSPSPATSSVNEPANAGSPGPDETPSEETPSEIKGTDQPGSNGNQNTVGNQNAVGSSDNSKNDQSNAATQPVVGEPSHNDNGEGSSYNENTTPTAVAAVAISYAGSTLTPDTSSHYNIPQIGKISPGGSPVTTNNIVYSLAPSATALISNGQTIPLTTFAAAVPENIKQPPLPALTFAGATYTADSSSRIVVAGQTISPGGPAFTVSNTPISLAPGASIAVVGGITQSLQPSTPTAYPQLTFAGRTYTANSNSAIVIQGQTLIPGSPAITISNTPISLALSASIAVVGGNKK